MNIDIRKSIINNFKGNDAQEIMVSINESIKKGDEYQALSLQETQILQKEVYE